VDAESKSGYVTVLKVNVSGKHVRVTTDAWVRTYNRGNIVARLDD